jgi:hypothetical protein
VVPLAVRSEMREWAALSPVLLIRRVEQGHKNASVTGCSLGLNELTQRSLCPWLPMLWTVVTWGTPGRLQCGEAGSARSVYSGLLTVCCKPTALPPLAAFLVTSW